MSTSLREQIKSNMVALLSLTIAVTALFYNTWRNETTEQNRNLRTASFTVLQTLDQLQVITDIAHYDEDDNRGNPITGWGYVLLIEDMSDLLPEAMQNRAMNLKTNWADNWSSLSDDPAAEKAISQSIDQYRQDLKRYIKKLD